MLIHHYTNIEALAMILSTKKIRFNRLDRMDDLEQGQVEAQGIPLGKYTYVSCWTEEEEESIPLWNMYAGKEMGVRISLPEDMFKDHSMLGNLVGDEELGAKILDYMPKLVPTVTLKIPASEYFGKNYLVLPVHSHDLCTFYGSIFYTDDVQSYTNDACKKTCHNNGTYDLELNWNKVGTCKHSRWSFQKESRFILRIIPTEKEITLLDASQFLEYMNRALSTGLQPHFDFYDLPLKDDIFDNLEVTLSPSITTGQRVIVESLINRYAPNAKIKESNLRNSIKLKS